MESNKKFFFLVDDDADDRELFIEALSNVNPDYICLTAQNGLNAIEILDTASNELPHVIFLDINMPEMNGWQYLKWLKSNDRFKEIPVIIYSTSSHQRDKDLARDMGALFFFPKPERFSILCDFLAFVADKLPSGLHSEISFFVSDYKIR